MGYDPADKRRGELASTLGSARVATSAALPCGVNREVSWTSPQGPDRASGRLQHRDCSEPLKN
jgi:hypothetical protein